MTHMPDPNRHAVFRLAPPRFNVDAAAAERVIDRLMRWNATYHQTWREYAISQIAAAITAARKEGRR
jgi:hypothetical protein